MRIIIWCLQFFRKNLMLYQKWFYGLGQEIASLSGLFIFQEHFEMRFLCEREKYEMGTGATNWRLKPRNHLIKCLIKHQKRFELLFFFFHSSFKYLLFLLLLRSFLCLFLSIVYGCGYGASSALQSACLYLVFYIEFPASTQQEDSSRCFHKRKNKKQ